MPPNAGPAASVKKSSSGGCKIKHQIKRKPLVVRMTGSDRFLTGLTGSDRFIRRPNKLIRFWLFQAWPDIIQSYLSFLYPESKGENFHDALKRKESGERRVQVVQRNLVRLRLFVILSGKKRNTDGPISVQRLTPMLAEERSAIRACDLMPSSSNLPHFRVSRIFLALIQNGVAYWVNRNL